MSYFTARGSNYILVTDITMPGIIRVMDFEDELHEEFTKFVWVTRKRDTGISGKPGIAKQSKFDESNFIYYPKVNELLDFRNMPARIYACKEEKEEIDVTGITYYDDVKPLELTGTIVRILKVILGGENTPSEIMGLVLGKSPI